MRATAMENLLCEIVEADEEIRTEVRRSKLKNLFVDARILLSRQNDAAVLRRLLNRPKGE